MNPIKLISGRFRRFAADRRGNSLVEFGLILPILIFVFMGSMDIGQLVVANMKIYNAASSMADLVARDEEISTATLTDLFNAASQVATPLDIGANGIVIITSVSADDDDDPRIFWQQENGSHTSPSVVGSTIGESATLPASIQVDAQETIIVSEVFFDFEPIFGILDTATTIYHSAYYRPRLGSLREISDP
jgi:Flp pilus assembly protein TadG